MHWVQLVQHNASFWATNMDHQDSGLLTMASINVVFFVRLCVCHMNGSSSPVLTATCLSYGSLCDFLTFLPEHAWGSDAPTDLHAKWLKWRGFAHRCAFCSKNGNFLKPMTPIPQNPQNLPNFGRDRKFSLDFAFKIGGLRSKHPLFFVGAPQKCHSE